jgi:hypothetical protein
MAKGSENAGRMARYLVAYACFRCRKSFKHAPAEMRTCPEYRGPLHAMGRSFRAPKQTNGEQWLKVQTLYALGFRFVGNGNYEGERLPRTLRQVAESVARNPQHRLRLAPIDTSLLP